MGPNWRHDMGKKTTICVLAVGCILAQRAAMIAADPNPVTFHDLSTMKPWPYGPYPEARGVVTGASSLIIVVVPTGYKQTPHRHNQEQFSLGIGGTIDYNVGGTIRRLGSHGLGFMPSNVMHGMINESGEAALMMEFQPVRRPEWLPPHPQVPPQPQSAEPISLPAERQVTLDFDLSSGGWRTDRTGTRTKSLAGQMIQASFVDLSAPRSSMNLTEHPSTHERFVMVLSGRATARVASERRDVGREILMVLSPAASRVTLESVGRAGTEVVVFEWTDAGPR